jgi:CRP-like cAMP-binding protein
MLCQMIPRPSSGTNKEVNCKCKVTPRGRLEKLPHGLLPRFFSGLTPGQLATVVNAAVHQRFKPRAVAVSQGAFPNRVLMLTSGRAAHFVLTREGNKVPLYWLVPGQLFGGTALLAEPTPYLTNTEIQTHACALAWSREAMHGLLCSFPVLMENALSIAVTEQLAWQLAVRMSFASDDAPMRIARLLVGLACGIGQPRSGGIEIASSNEELAAGAGVTPYTFSRILSRWKRAGVLTKRRGVIVLLRPELLSTGP